MDVKLNLRSVNFDVDQKLVDFIQGRINKLTQYFDRIIEADVYLKLNNNQEIDNKTVEIRLYLPGKDLFAKKHGKKFESAADEVIEALRRQTKKRKAVVKRV